MTGGLRCVGNPREGIFELEAPKYTKIWSAVPVGLTEEVGDMDSDSIFRLTINCTWHRNALER